MLVAATNILPQRFRFQRYKPWMRTELGLWWLVVMIGVGTYYLWYLAPPPQAQAQTDELTRLRAENADLMRLRNEVRQLRDQNQQLTRQIQSAQTQAQAAQAQAEQFRNTAVQASAQAQQAQAAAQAQSQTLACINNLRQIDAAKQQWAQQNNRPSGTPVTPGDIARFLRGNILPTCPAGGIYLINSVGLPPTCSTPGHVVPKGQ